MTCTMDANTLIGIGCKSAPASARTFSRWTAATAAVVPREMKTLLSQSTTQSYATTNRRILSDYERPSRRPRRYVLWACGESRCAVTAFSTCAVSAFPPTARNWCQRTRQETACCIGHPGLDRKTLMRSALCNRILSAVIVSYARHLASKVSIRRGDSDLSRRASLLATLLGTDVRGVGGEEITPATMRQKSSVSQDS